MAESKPLAKTSINKFSWSESTLFNELFDKASIGMFILSPKGDVIQSNAEAHGLFGLVDHDLGLHFEKLFYCDPPIDIYIWYKNAINGQGQNFQQVLRLKHPTDDTLWGIVNLSLISLDDVEKVILCQVKNISELREAEGIITQQGHLLVELINSLPDNIYVKDKDSKFILANSRVSKVMGATHSAELIGKSDFDFYPKKLAMKYFNDEQEIITSGNPKLKIIEQVLDGENNLRWYSTSKIPLRDKEGKIIGIMGIGRDITDLVKEHKILRKAKHEAEKADQLKSAFLANLSHEIRTPLNGILGFSQFLQQTNISEDKRQKYLDLIIKNGQSLLEIISNIIDISKIDSGQINLNNKYFILNELLDQLYEQTIYDAKQLGKEQIKILLEPGLSAEESALYSDDLRIKQVLQNLLTNAIKFTDEGVIRFGYIKERNNYKFFVKDTGIGIADENQSVIFERFRQGDNSLTRQFGGNGLGLSIAKGLVQMMGGKIGVISELSKGSEFYFTIPIHVKKIETEESNLKKSHVFDKKIALVNYNDHSYEILEYMLIQYNIELIRANSMNELKNIICIDGHSADLLLIKYQAESEADITSIQRIKEYNPNIPIIFHLDSSSIPIKDSLILSGADDCVAEPISIDFLMANIKRLTNWVGS